MKNQTHPTKNRRNIRRELAAERQEAYSKLSFDDKKQRAGKKQLAQLLAERP